MTSNITKDASTPADKTVTNSSSITSASFSPPANTLLCVMVDWEADFSSNPSLTDSVGSTYNHKVHISSSATQSNCGSDIYFTYFSTAPGSMTVTYTVHGGADPPAALHMYCLVLDNCDSGQSGIASGTSQSGFSGNSSSLITLTPAFTGSWIIMVSGITINTTSTTVTAQSGTTTLINTYGGTTAGEYGLDGANETGPSGSTTVGWSFNHSNIENASCAMEVKASGAPPVNVNLSVGQINVNGPNPQPTTGKAVPLTTGNITLAGPAPTVTATRITSGGTGSPGLIKLQYISPATEALTSSLSPVTTTDVFGNAVPAGYMGPVSAIQPGSSPTVVEGWHQLTLTNASPSGNGVNGMWYRYRSDNSTELAWDVTLTSSAATIATLPTSYVPSSVQNLMSSWYGTGPAAYNDTFSPALQVTLTGSIIVQNCDSLAISLCGNVRIPLDI